MSSASPMTRDDLMPGAGSSSYSVTTGPGWALTISPRTPKSPSTPSSARELASSSDLLSGWRSDAFGAVSTEIGGSSNLSDDLRDGARGAAFLRGARARALPLPLLPLLRNPRSSRWGQRRRGAAAETGLLAFERGRARRRRARHQRADRPGSTTARAAPSRSSRHGTPIRARSSCVVFFLERRVVVLDRGQFLFLRARTQAAGDQEGRAASAANRMSPSTRR